MRHGCLSSAQRRALLRPFPCNTVIGVHSPAKCGPCGERLWPSRGPAVGKRSAMRASASSATAVAAGGRGGRARPSHVPAPDRPPGPARSRQGPHREHGSRLPCGDRTRATASSATCRRPRTARRWSSTTTSSSGSSGVPGRISHLHAREPRPPALQGPGHAHPHLRRVPGPRRRPRAAAGGGEDQQRHAARRRSSTGSPARRGPTRARSRSCPSISTSSRRWPSWPRPSRAGP